MIIRLIVAACLTLTAPSVAAAQATPDAERILPLSEIEQRLSGEGFRVLKIERYATSVEVKGYDRSGRCVEMHLDPRTGAVLRRESDDDCARRDRSDDHRRGRGDR